MSVRIFPSKLQGSLRVIGSKSLSHRYMIGAALASGTSTLTQCMQSDDLEATKHMLTALGAHIEGDTVRGPLHFKADKTLNANASGSTLRFLIPLALLSSHPTRFTGEARLPFRSLASYKTMFEAKNLTFKTPSDTRWLPLEVQGPLRAGRFEIDGSVSSQFVSGLMFALPLLEGDSEIVMTSPLQSEPYVAMTLKVLKDFGVKVEQTPYGYHIPGQQTYTPVHTTIESDYSHSVFFLAAGAASGPIELSHFKPDSVQGDRVVLSLLQTMGAKSQHVGDTLRIERSILKPFHADFEDTPDLVPMMGLLAATIDGVSTLRGLARLKHKESDRLEALRILLTHLGVTHTLQDDVLTIIGTGQLSTNHVLPTFEDHRWVMALSMLAPFMREPYVLEEIDSVNKSYPEFFKAYQALGGQFEVLKEAEYE